MGRVRGHVPGHAKAQPKPLTPLLAPIRVAMKPLTPLRGANQHLLKPRAPLQAETRLNSAIFRPQWCQWFHSTMITGQQRRPRFHPRRSAASRGVLSFMQHAPAPAFPLFGHPRTKSHAIPLSPAPTRAHKRWNIKDLSPHLEGLAGELHATFLSSHLGTMAMTTGSVTSGAATPLVLGWPRNHGYPSHSRQPTPQMLQTSSNRSIFNRSIRGPVTNVVKPSPKHPISGEIAGGLTTFVTIAQEDVQKVAVKSCGVV